MDNKGTSYIPLLCFCVKLFLYYAFVLCTLFAFYFVLIIISKVCTAALCLGIRIYRSLCEIVYIYTPGSHGIYVTAHETRTATVCNQHK
jgi:hypothetical protein